jgi:hypothetical protein
MLFGSIGTSEVRHEPDSEASRFDPESVADQISHIST